MGKQTAKKYVMFLFGIMFSALGVSLITGAGLGTSPVTSLAYVLSFIFPQSLGTFTFLVNLVMFILQVILLGKEFEKIQFLQIPFTFIFSSCIDWWMYVISGFSIAGYAGSILMLLFGCAFLGFGIALEVLPAVLILPGEGLVRVIAKQTEKEFGKVKVIFDLALVLSAVVLSFVCLDNISGIREGTVIAAFLVGGFSQFFLNAFRNLNKYICQYFTCLEK